MVVFREAFHPSVPSSIHGWHHTGKKTLAAPPLPPSLCTCVTVQERHAWPPGEGGGGIPKILISIQGQTLNNVGSSPVIFVISSLLPWSTVCCYLMGHKQCKHQDFQKTSRFSAARVLMNTCRIVIYRKVLEMQFVIVIL